MNPKFSVGEVVILQSPRFPEYKGGHVVYKIWSDPEQTFTCRSTGTVLRVNMVEAFSYHFEQPLLDPKGREICFAESSLKKRQEKGNMNFKGLITTLKSPQKVEWD